MPDDVKRVRRNEELKKLFNERAPIAAFFGMTLDFDEENRALITLPYNPSLDHAMKGIHGGVYMTLLDSAAWFTAAASRDDECWIATSEMAVHFYRPTKGVALKAVGTMKKDGKRQAVVEAVVYDPDGNAVGHGIGTFIALPEVPGR